MSSWYIGYFKIFVEWGTSGAECDHFTEILKQSSELSTNIQINISYAF